MPQDDLVLTKIIIRCGNCDDGELFSLEPLWLSENQELIVYGYCPDCGMFIRKAIPLSDLWNHCPEQGGEEENGMVFIQEGDIA